MRDIRPIRSSVTSPAPPGPGARAGVPAALILASLLTALPARVPAQEVPTPEAVIGWKPGADYKLADYSQISDYFRRLDEASDRLLVEEIGTTAEGRTMLLAVISSEENLRRVQRWKEIARRLAMARGLSDEEARALATEGKAIVWIDGGLHATEVAHAQHTPLLAHHLVTGEDPEIRRIRERAVVLLMPVMNPDGLEIVAKWYRRNLGTPFETSPLPVLYQKYVGHDNNRDWFMLLQPESRAVAHQLWFEWLPQIVYNHHQTGPFPSRIFIPPFTDPMNPHIPPLVMRGVNLVGSAMGLRFAEEGKPGAVSRKQYSVWWNGGMRTAPYFHNQVGILTETNLYRYATPRYYSPDSIPDLIRARGGVEIAAKRPSVFYPNPWQGGWWRIGDAVDYMMTGSLAVTKIAADLKEQWLYNIYLMGKRAIEAGEAGTPFAYVIPAEQWDGGEARELVGVLRRGGVEVHGATEPFTAGGESYASGSFIAFAAQPFRAHLMDLMEPQEYPDRRLYPGGPPDPPYDLAGWTLPLQMGVGVDRVDEPFEAVAVLLLLAEKEVSHLPGEVRGSGPVYLLSPRQNAAFRAVNRLIAAGVRVSRAVEPFEAANEAWPAGTFVLQTERRRAERVAAELGLDFVGSARPSVRLYQLTEPRVGLYKSWVANMDEGWTRWIFEQYGFRFETLEDTEVRDGDLARFDAIVLPDQDAGDILRGHPPATMPEEYTGGVGAEGAANLKRFVEGGGTLIALDGASDFAIEQLGLPLKDAVKDLDRERFFIPGSLIRIAVDTTDPLAYGMQDAAAATFVRSRAFEVIPPAAEGENRAPREVDVVARYAEEDLLMSGWELGAKQHLAGKSAVLRVPLGRGNVVLVGFRSQFRAQPRGTYKLLFNALYASTVQELLRETASTR